MVEMDNTHEFQLAWLDMIHAIINTKKFNDSYDSRSDIRYILHNMIAKYASCAEYYHVSKGTESLICDNRPLMTLVKEGDKIDMKKYFYGKDKPTLLEHTVPASVVAKELLKTDCGHDDCKKILTSTAQVTVLTREENGRLTEFGLHSKMPEGWSIGEHINARYSTAHIALSDMLVKRDEKIYR